MAELYAPFGGGLGFVLQCSVGGGDCRNCSFYKLLATHGAGRPHGDLAHYGSSVRPPVDYLYSLYDALVSINVPSDKARAVVDAMERDMGTTLATKQDLEVMKLATRQDLELLKQAMDNRFRSEEHTSELQSPCISYAVSC